ncbi:hypothetical protein HJC23_000557 [Cyclotella cryptica]|uniref:Uncharacterized protein n=1 Tax=Cyclotella cryptica TaxID=29204 RepID=A0ABD3PTR4_9STRA
MPRLLLALASIQNGATSFSPAKRLAPLPKVYQSSHLNTPTKLMSSTGVSVANDSVGASNQQISEKISKLKRVLEQEYISFFNPMVDAWYAEDVTFDDPMTSLSGVNSYRNNVDMLAGRTLMGKMLFDGAGINLHSVTGGEVVEGINGQVEISDIVTRWTLRVTAKVLPWKPEAVFSGISVYTVQPGGKQGVSIVAQTDYWDSINIKPMTSSLMPQEQYQKVPKSVAINDFLSQLKPEGFRAVAAAPELPYLLLRRGNGYELRRYPGFVGILTPYQRRDYGFGSLGAFAKGMNPLAPSIMKVWNDDNDGKDKVMMWPLEFTLPGQGSAAPSPPALAVEKAGEGQWKSISLSTRSESVIAVRSFEDAAMGPVVRNSDRELRELLKRDGLVPTEESSEYVVFAQYDAVHSMGKRRSEVWIELKDGGHPF